jgi:hypothetical protein
MVIQQLLISDHSEYEMHQQMFTHMEFNTGFVWMGTPTVLSMLYNTIRSHIGKKICAYQ